MPETKDNKILFGLCNVHIAAQTETVNETTGEVEYSYETPQAVEGAVSMSAEPQGENTPFYADNIVYYRTIVNNGYEGDLEFAKIPDWVLEKYLGYEKDSKGVLFEKTTITENPRFALLFQFEGDVKAVRRVIYNCALSRPSVSGSTKEASITPATSTVSYAADPRKDGLVKAISTKETDTTTYDGWFKNVVQPTTAAAGA